MHKAASDKTIYKCATLHENEVFNVHVSLKSLLIFTCLGGILQYLHSSGNMEVSNKHLTNWKHNKKNGAIISEHIKMPILLPVSQKQTALQP
jgi:hypothetical protein